MLTYVLDKLRKENPGCIDSINQVRPCNIGDKLIIKIELIGRLISYDNLKDLIEEINKIDHTEYEIIIRWDNYRGNLKSKME